MQIRPATPADAAFLADIDGTIESTRYLHLDRSGEDLAPAWHIEERPLRQRLISPNPLDDNACFLLRQITAGSDEGLALVAEHENLIVACLIAQPRPHTNTLRLIDLRVDYDQRRQGLGFSLLCQAIQHARQLQLRAVSAQTFTNNIPAARFLLKLGFHLTGLDTHRHSNHDLVKESVTLFWHAALD
ncbi:MAG: GNAT family N-acetyltransferase [Planctomycetota bacterium]|nr:GNAT family N-acetyltransferase [Planctomycetota bacterium]